MATNIETLYDSWRGGTDRIRPLDKLFVIGCAKSGTTWLANLLDAHDEIVVKGEGGFAWRLVPFLAEAFRGFNEHQKHMDAITHLGDLELLMTARTLIDGQWARYVKGSGKDISRVRVVGDKTPQHAVGMASLDQLYPRCKFLHILRDPRDTATSAWFHFGKTDGRSFEQYIEYYITQAWPINVNSARQSGRALADRYREIRYEDLRSDPIGQTKSIFEYLGVASDDAQVRKCVNSASFEKKSGGRRPGQKDNSSFYRSGTSGDWRNHLPMDEAEHCCAKVADLMLSCGYDPSCEADAATALKPGVACSTGAS